MVKKKANSFFFKYIKEERNLRRIDWIGLGLDLVLGLGIGGSGLGLFWSRLGGVWSRSCLELDALALVLVSRCLVLTRPLVNNHNKEENSLWLVKEVNERVNFSWRLWTAASDGGEMAQVDCWFSIWGMRMLLWPRCVPLNGTALQWAVRSVLVTKWSSSCQRT